MTNRKIKYWVIPPEADAEFVAGVEDVLDNYAKPYEPACPVLCMDEQFCRCWCPDTPRKGRQVTSTCHTRLDFHHTPKHGSRLNIAENELSALTRQSVAA